jgi:N-acetyl-anhydromuramyl-L-alanine amidase AmpD
MESPNQEYLRRGNKIQAFVIHKTEGCFKSAVDWCCNPKSQVSYHYIIDFNGDDVCLVMPENTAWHAGLLVNPQRFVEKLGKNPNLTTIGIALAGMAGSNPTQKQIAKCAELISILALYYSIPLDKTTVITHNSIRADKLCPGVYVDIGVILYLTKLPL